MKRDLIRAQLRMAPLLSKPAVISGVQKHSVIWLALVGFLLGCALWVFNLEGGKKRGLETIEEKKT